MRIRLAAEPDVPVINAIGNHYIVHTHVHFALAPVRDEEMLADWRATRDAYPWYVADDRGVIGFARASRWKGRCAYDWAAEVSVYLRPDATGRGVGRALYERLFATLRAQGYRTAIAGVALPNEASVRLHEAMGMTRVGVFDRVGWKFGRWIDVAYWLLNWPPNDPGRDAPAPVRPVAEADPSG